MTRSVHQVLLAVSFFLLAVPLTLVTPGVPSSLKADEAAYFMMAQSLAHDGDLELGVEDVDRAFDEFPFRPITNLIAMTNDGWHTVLYGKPYIYSLFAAPFVRFQGANGLVFFNMLLLVSMVWMGALYLSRFGEGSGPALFAAGFFLLSAGFSYVFWLQPEVFNMASVCACLFFAFHRTRRRLELPWTWVLLSGAALAPAVYNKPILAALGLGPLILLLVERRFKAVVLWVLAAAVALGLVVGVAVALTGHPTPYLGVKRQGVTVCEPGVVPIGPGPEGGAAPDEDRPTGGAWSWLFRIPSVDPPTLTANATYFLVGRHTGLFLYFPFALAALILFALATRRRSERWGLLLGILVVALFFLIFIPRNWQGGGGFVGNRYFVNAYPAFLFLVTRIPKRWFLPITWGLGGLLLGPLVFSPFSRSGPEPTLQSHVRNFPYPYFPLEQTLREVPGYHDTEVSGLRMKGRKDLFLPRGASAWVRGASQTELWLRGPEPLHQPVFLVSSEAPGNRVSLAIDGGSRQSLSFGEEATAQRVVLEVPALDAEDPIRYRLEVEASTGRIRGWHRQMPPNSCGYFNANPSYEESFFVGAEISYLGELEEIEADVWGLEWGSVDAPAMVSTGEEFSVAIEVKNLSGQTWPVRHAARVRLAYRWVDASGVATEGLRTELAEAVEPSRWLRQEQRVEAPMTAGRYTLELDPVYEFVGWFSDHPRGSPHRIEIEVVESEIAAPETGDPLVASEILPDEDP
ncbi:MAG: hypothetical protein K8J08_20015 [Thermoanaerobaculia bacterium]|nr:hypothetical protein [Thermoanaerobaculia bacterium]